MRWEELGELRASCEYDPDGEDGGIEALIAYKDALEDRVLTPKDAIDLRITFDRELTAATAAGAVVAFAEQLHPAVVEGKPLAASAMADSDKDPSWGYGRARVRSIGRAE